MLFLRLLLICWLAVAVPTTAAASIINEGHCQRMQEKPVAAGMNHALHSMHTQPSADSMAMDHMNHQAKQSDSGCTCGCNCSNQHCTTGFSSLMGGLSASPDFFDGTTRQIASVQPSNLASAHHLDLLRPPTLS